MKPLRETSQEYPTSMAGSDRSRLTVVEYLRDPAVPTDWMFNVGLRSIWQQTHNQLAEVIGPYVNPSPAPVDFTSTPGHLVFDFNDDVFIYYGLYKVWLGFFNGLDIDVINGTCNFGPSVIGTYPGQSVSNNSQGVLVLRIVEKRFHSGSTLADLEGGSSGSNAYGNIKIPQDLQATFGSNTFDTHNEWRVKALLYTAPTASTSFFETVDTKTTDIVIGLFNVDNSGNITNFYYLIPIQNDTIGSLLNSFAGQPFSANHRVAFTDSKNRFLDTQSLVVKYGQARIDNANNLVHNITGSPNDLSGNQLEVLLSTNNVLKNLPTGPNYPDGTTLTLFTSISSEPWVIDFSGNIKMSPGMLATYSTLSLHQVLGLSVPINSEQPVTFLRVGSFWYIMSPEPYQMLNRMMFTRLDNSLLHWKWFKQMFGSGSSSPGNQLFDRYFLGTTVNIGTGSFANHSVTQQCFQNRVDFGSTSFVNLTWLSLGSYFLVKYRNNLTPGSSRRSYVDLEIEIYFEIDPQFQGSPNGFLLGPPSAGSVDSPFKGSTNNDVTPITDMLFQFVYFFQLYSFLRTNLLQVLDLPSIGQHSNTKNVIHLNGSLVIWPNLNNFPVEFQSLPLSGFLQFDKTSNSVTKFLVRGTLTRYFWSQWRSLVTDSLVGGKFGEDCDVVRLHGRYYFK